MVKPFGSQELLARAEALLRRGSHSTDQVRSSAIRDELVEIDFARHAVTVCAPRSS